jgi:hypothetical protein
MSVVPLLTIRWTLTLGEATLAVPSATACRLPQWFRGSRISRTLIRLPRAGKHYTTPTFNTYIILITIPLATQVIELVTNPSLRSSDIDP